MRTEEGSGEAEPQPTLASYFHRRKIFWVLLVTLMVGAGDAVLLILPEQYTAEARVVVGSQSLQAQAVPGYAVATEQLATTYSRFFKPERSADAAVTIGPIPHSAVVRIEATSSNRATSLMVAEAAAESFVQSVNAAVVDDQAATDLLDQYQAAQAEVISAEEDSGGAVEARASLEALRLRADALGRAYQEHVQNASSGSSTVTLIQAATPSGDNAVTRIELAVVAALTLGILMIFWPRVGRRLHLRANAPRV